MKIAVKGKRAKGFGIAGFFLFAAAYGMYEYSTIKTICKLAEWEPFSLANPQYISLIIEALFFLGFIYLAVDGSVKYFKNRPTGTFTHGIRLMLAFTVYSFSYPIYNKLLLPASWEWFSYATLFTSTTGIFLLITIGFSIASFFLQNRKNLIRHIIFAGVFLPILVLDIINLINYIPYYGDYWMYDQHLMIFGPILRILTVLCLSLSYFFEKKEETAPVEEENQIEAEDIPQSE